MSRRVPLWVDLTEVPSARRAAIQEMAEQVQADRILDGDDVTRVTINHAGDQQTAMDAEGPVVVDGRDWTIIPLENLIAARRNRPGTLFAVARNAHDAERFCNVLDVGVHGIVLVTDDPHVVKETAQMLDAATPRPDDTKNSDPTNHVIALTAATVENIQDAGMAERVCIDCTERFRDGEGMLVGSTASSFALVHAETMASDYVNARPFRVNAGAIHSYALGPGDSTQYLSECEGGTTILAVDGQGDSRPVQVGRAKIEHRPHSRITWTLDDGRKGNAVLQHAETVRLVRPDHSTVAVTALREGDRILVHQSDAARHMGMAVSERLVER